jgi:hypothetical protein
VHHFKNAKTTSAKSIELQTKLYRPIQNNFSNLQFLYLEINGSKLVLLFFCYNCFFARDIYPNSQNIYYAKTIHAKPTILIKVLDSQFMLDSQFQVSSDFMFSSLFGPQTLHAGLLCRFFLKILIHIAGH